MMNNVPAPPAEDKHSGKHTISDPLTAALYYHEHGCCVVPCCTMTSTGTCTFPHTHASEKSIGKVPILGAGWPQARLTRADIIQQWTQHPTANAGVLLDPSGLLAVDLDSREAEEEASKYGLPPGPQVRTGRGVQHYFQNPKGIIGLAIRQGESRSIDVLSKGIVVGFGSIHRSGKRYELLTSWEEWPLEDPPLWAEQLLLDSLKNHGAAADISDDLHPVDLEALQLPRWLSALIREGHTIHPEKYPSRSEAVWAVLTALVEASHDTDTIASIVLDARYQISAKPREQGARWLAAEIGRAHAKTASRNGGPRPTAPPEPEWSDAEENARYTQQERPLDEAPPHSGHKFVTYNGSTLRNKDFPPLQEAIPDLLPVGLTVLAGPPKLGKSFMVLNIACAVASGGKAFSRFDLKPGACLYLALEDSERRMQNRLLTLLGDYEEWPDTLPDFIHHAPLSGAGLEGEITGWVTTHPHARLVVIDTLAKVKPSRQRGQDPYQEDYRISARLQQLALTYGIALLLVHHTKKGPEEDFLSAVSGTHGVTGAADAVWVLKRKRGELQGTLSVTGRDIEERDLAMKIIDGDWLCMGDATEVKRSESRKKILDALAHGGPLPPLAIAHATQLNRGTVRRLLTKLLNEAAVIKQAEQYSIPHNICEQHEQT